MPTTSRPNANASTEPREIVPIGQLSELIEVAVEQRQNLLIHGGAGLGKTSIMGQTMSRLELTWQLFLVACRESSDLMGCPWTYTNPETGEMETRWAVPSMVVEARRYSVAAAILGKPHLVYWDELNRTDNINVLNASSQVILGGNFGDHHVDNLLHVGSVNDAADSTGVLTIPDHLRNRFVHVYVKQDPPAFGTWARKNGIHPAVITYIHNFPDHLYVPDRKADAFPTPRSWEFVSNVVKANKSYAIEKALVFGAIGSHHGSQFLHHLDMFRTLAGTFDIPRIIANPDTEPVPTEVSAQYAVANALSLSMNPANANNCARYLLRMSGEMQTFGILSALNRTATGGMGNIQTSPLFDHSPAINDWVTRAVMNKMI